MGRGAIFVLALTLGATPTEASFQQLFQLIRNKNANVVEYGVRVEPGGLLDPDRPLEANWILKAEDGRREGLSFFERNYAYGISWKAQRPGEVYEATLVCCKDRLLLIQKNGDRYEADTPIGGDPSRLLRIVVTADESKSPPKVQSVELYGRSLKAGNPTYEALGPR